MGTAKIWWYPDPLGTVEEIDLGEQLSELEDEPQRDQLVTESITGATTTVHLSARGRYRIERSRMISAAVAASLEAFRNHVQRGGHFSFCEDHSKAVAAFVVPPGRGATSLTCLGAPWPYVTSPAIVSGDLMRLQSASPNRYEEFVSSSTTFTGGGTSISLSAGVKFEYGLEPWALACWRGFYPLLRLPASERNQRIFTSDHRITWSLDFYAEESPAQLEAFASAYDLPVSTGTSTFRGLEPEAHHAGPPGLPDIWGA